MNRKINKILFGDRRYKPENRGGILTPLIAQGDIDEDYEVIIQKRKKNSCLGCGCLIVILIVAIFVISCIVTSYQALDNAAQKVSKESSVENSEFGSESSPAKTEPAERTWTNRKDGRTITGKYLDYKDGKATVLRDNGKTVTIPLELLSDEDREYIKSIRKQEK